jgi:hypothetical protein
VQKQVHIKGVISFEFGGDGRIHSIPFWLHSRTVFSGSKLVLLPAIHFATTIQYLTDFNPFFLLPFFFG